MNKQNFLLLEAMFIKHYQEWCLLSYSYLGDMDDAKDVIQNIFIKLLQKQPKEPVKNLKSYIATAVRNESLKKIKYNQKIYTIDHESLEATSYESELIEQEVSARILKEIEVLPHDNKKVFILCVIEGVKYENAAEILGITINTVKYHLKRSFKILRLNLKDLYL